MGENSAIQWTDHTFNPWIGCQRVSPGCVNCYAEHRNTFVRIQRKAGNELWGPKGARQVTSDANWKKPLTWNRAAEKAGRRFRVFCASLADVFEDRRDLDAPRARLFELIESTPHLDWQLLTKRIDRVMEMVPESWCDGFPSNVWMGTSVEDQRRANERIPELKNIPARVRFLSAEPLIESIATPLAMHGLERIHWVIVGGESGDGARPFNVEWARQIIRLCSAAGAACFIKQLGAVACAVTPTDGPTGKFRTHNGHRQYQVTAQRMALKDSHGGDWNEWPDQLRVREFPAESTCLREWNPPAGCLDRSVSGESRLSMEACDVWQQFVLVRRNRCESTCARVGGRRVVRCRSATRLHRGCPCLHVNG
jgi:protein gp37